MQRQRKQNAHQLDALGIHDHCERTRKKSCDKYPKHAKLQLKSFILYVCTSPQAYSLYVVGGGRFFYYRFFRPKRQPKRRHKDTQMSQVVDVLLQAATIQSRTRGSRSSISKSSRAPSKRRFSSAFSAHPRSGSPSSHMRSPSQCETKACPPTKKLKTKREMSDDSFMYRKRSKKGISMQVPEPLSCSPGSRTGRRYGTHFVLSSCSDVGPSPYLQIASDLR